MPDASPALTAPAPADHPTAPRPPRLSLWQLFDRFLGFGIHAWGGPVAQIGMLRHELVEQEKWISSQRFNRALAVYQVLPGPEAHELCCYFGYLARGRVGALLAGLGFMLPGFGLMLALSWVYARYGLASPLVVAAFAGVKPAVAALVVRAVHRIGGHALHKDRWLWAIAIGSFAASVAGGHFVILIAAGGVAFLAAGRRWWPLAGFMVLAILAAGAWALWRGQGAGEAGPTPHPDASAATHVALLLSGLKAGLLTFGGAYTVIPFLRNDAVQTQGWLTDAQFLDGIGLSGVLPAPLVIFGTFVGYLAGGWIGAVAMTAGIFAPAFAFTIVGHGIVERVVNHAPTHRFLAGVTAAVVGLIAATAVQITVGAVASWGAVVIFATALAILFLWKSKAAIPSTVALGAAAGLLFVR